MENVDASLVTFINPTYFPGKLWRLVNDPEIAQSGGTTAGKGYLFTSKPSKLKYFLSQPRHLSEYFRTTDFISFVRQLNLYGFKKERIDNISDKQSTNNSSIKAQLHHFQNPYFKRNEPELLLKMKRLTPLNKAKLAGLKVTSRKPKRFHNVMQNTPQETSGLIKTGSTLLEHQGTPYPHPCNVPQQEQRSNIPHHGFYTPVYQHCSPDFLASTLPSFQQPAASYSPCDYYPDYSVRYTDLIDQDPFWNAADVPESRMRDLEKDKEELDAILDLALDMQAEVDARRLLQL